MSGPDPVPPKPPPPLSLDEPGSPWGPGGPEGPVGPCWFQVSVCSPVVQACGGLVSASTTRSWPGAVPVVT